MSDKKLQTRLDIMGVRVPIEMSLADNATESERAAWDHMVSATMANAPMSFGVKNEPAKPREEKSKSPLQET